MIVALAIMASAIAALVFLLARALKDQNFWRVEYLQANIRLTAASMEEARLRAELAAAIKDADRYRLEYKAERMANQNAGSAPLQAVPRPARRFHGSGGIREILEAQAAAGSVEAREAAIAETLEKPDAPKESA